MARNEHASHDALESKTLSFPLIGLIGLRVGHRTLCRVSLAIVCTTLCSHGGRALADDGYQLWLKYREIENKELLMQYRGAVSSFIVTGESETCAAARDELNKGLRGLLGKEIPTVTSIKENSQVVGTSRSSDLVRRLFHAAFVEALGRDGSIT